MQSIRHTINLGAPATAAFEAVATPTGQQGWWCKDSDIPTRVGAESELRFNKDGHIVTMRFRIDELDTDRRVLWTCVANDNPMWIGSTLTWEISANGSKPSVAFSHDGLDGEGEPPEMITNTWTHFMGSLKSYVETGQGQPW